MNAIYIFPSFNNAAIVVSIFGNYVEFICKV